MQAQITELISLLNKGISNLPQTLTMLVKEYQRQQLVIGIIDLIFVICVIIGTVVLIKGLVYWYSDKNKMGWKVENGYNSGDLTGISWIVNTVAGMLAITFITVGLVAGSDGATALVHAASPTISLIQSIK